MSMTINDIFFLLNTSTFIFFIIFSVEDLLFQKVDQIIISEAFIVNSILSLFFIYLHDFKIDVSIIIFKIIFFLIFLRSNIKGKLGGADVKIILLYLINPTQKYDIFLLFPLFLYSLPDLFIFFFFFLFILFFFKLFFIHKKIKRKKPLIPFFLLSLILSFLF